MTKKERPQQKKGKRKQWHSGIAALPLQTGEGALHLHHWFVRSCDVALWPADDVRDVTLTLTQIL